MTPLPPGATIGILGGGQLGRLLALAAGQLGFDVHIYCPEQNCPASRVAAKTTLAAYDDAAALARFAAQCDVVTYEFESVPAQTVIEIERAGTAVRPNARALEKSQDRLTEKTFLDEIGIPTVAFAPLEDGEGLAAALAGFGDHAILKTRREGYDGKGQIMLGGARGRDGLQEAEMLANAQPCLLEAFAPFECEISVIVARGRSADGTIETVTFDAAENFHTEGVLKRSCVPAQVSAEIQHAASQKGKMLAEALDYIGVLGIEFFVMPDGDLLANEFAPRVHNSGHWTPEGCLTGQFEQHIRAIAGWPLGPVTRICDVEMDNLFGTDVSRIPADFAADVKIVSYGKTEPRAGRKMAHITRRIPPKKT